MFSIGATADLGLVTKFTAATVTVLTNEEAVMVGYRDGKLYHLDIQVKSPNQVLIGVVSHAFPLEVWRKRLVHVNYDVIKIMAKE